MFRKLYPIFSLLLVATMLLSACSSATTSTQQAATQVPAATKAAEPAATTAPAEPTATTAPVEPAATLVLWVDALKAPVFQKVADDFLAKYNVKIDIQVTSFGQIRDRFQTAAPAGEAADIIIVPHDQGAVLVSNGLIAPLDLGNKKELFLKSALDAFTIDGKLYGMPYVVENVALFYNKELVTDLPKTWEELMAMGKKLQDEGKVTYCLGLSDWNYHAYALYTSFGGYVFGKDAQGNYNPQDLGLDNEGSLKAVKFLEDNVKNGCLPSAPDGNALLQLFTEGKLPLFITGPWNLATIKTSGVSYGITGFPKNGAPFSGVYGFMVNAKSPNVLLAQTFLTEFVATDDVMAQLSAGETKASAFKPVFEKTTDSDLLAIGQAGINAVPMPNIPAMGSVWGAWGDAITLVATGKQESDVAMKEAAKKIRDVIANPLTGMVNAPGSYQAKAGCTGDWQPDCKATEMKKSEDGKTYISGPFKLPAGDYEVKVALDGGWTTNYGAEGKAGGDNIKFTLAADGEVSFSYDLETHILTVTIK